MSWRTTVLAATALAVATVAPLPAAAAHTTGEPVRTCESLTAISLPRTTVVSAVEDAGDATTPPSCRLTMRVTDPVDSGAVTVWVYLPSHTWNGRFQGVGGGGFLGGDPARLVEPLRAGYAAAATDAGHPGATADFALNADGTLNWPAIKDFGYEGIRT
jgi:feruloyl esterase